MENYVVDDGQVQCILIASVKQVQVEMNCDGGDNGDPSSSEDNDDVDGGCQYG